jgi:hypoxia up-regulated 1
VRVVDLPDMSAKLLAESKEKLRLLDEHDAKKKAREGALNNLETFIIEARERMYSDIYESSITEEEKEKVHFGF